MALRELAYELIILVMEECLKVPGFEKLQKAGRPWWVLTKGIKREYEDMTHQIKKA